MSKVGIRFGQLIIASFLLVAKVSPAFASVTVPNDSPYSVFRTSTAKQSDTQYIFTGRAQDFLHEFIAYHQALRTQYDQSFGWSLDETTHLILTSDRQQIANAYATTMPLIESVWFPAGSGMLENFAASSWLLMLNAHEVAHLYQLNAKGPWNSRAKSIFGNSPLTLFFGIPFFVHPNLFAPTFLLEGNAVFNESRMNMGGRLHSSEMRALVFALALAGEISPNSLINSRLQFPYGEGAYLNGGYFFAHLARKYGVNKTNQFFVEAGNHYINPLRMNAAFRNHFGKSYSLEIREFVRGLQLQAQGQKAIAAPTLSRGEFFGGFNQNENSIWYLQTNQTRPPDLFQFNKKTQTLQQQQRDLEIGKVFFNAQQEPEVATSAQPNLHSIEYSLYGEGLKLNPAYRGQILTDQRAQKTVALDATHAWKEPELLVNDKYYDTAHSSGILDSRGSVYYFRQNGEDRILYKDREPLFKYRGFYGKPTEVGPRGEVFFIANTERGSSLFQFFKSEISQVIDSDRVVDARFINEKEFLIAEVDSQGYEVKVAPALIKSQQPAFYNYSFNSAPLVPAAMKDPEQLKQEQLSYNGLKQLSFSALQLESRIDPVKGVLGTTKLEWTDPLQWHSITLLAQRSSVPTTTYGIWYNYSRYLPELIAGYEYTESKHFVVNRHYLGLQLPLLKWRRYEAKVMELAKYQVDNELVDQQETWGLVSKFNLSYLLQPSLAVLPWRNLEVMYKNNLSAKSSAFAKSQNTSIAEVKGVVGFQRERFLTARATSTWAETRDIDIQLVPNTSVSKTVITRLSGSLEFKVKSAQALYFEFEKGYRVPAYSPRIPIGLMRVSPLAAVQMIHLNSSYRADTPSTLYEFGAGADVDVLLIHKIPVRLRPLLGFDNLAREQDFTNPNLSASFLFQKEF